LGQPDFFSSNQNQGGTVSSTTTNIPQSLSFDSTDSRLFVADDDNSRVLVFDLSHGITNDMPATNVLGQRDFASSQQNQGGTASSTTMKFPYVILYDSTHTRLFVNDDANKRLLIFDISHGMTNDMPAANVIGQPDMFSTNLNQGGSVSSTTVGYPEELAYDPINDRLFVGDDHSYRILLFNLSGGITNDMPASSVIGTPDFTSDDNSNNNASQTELNDPEVGMAYDTGDNRLWVTDDSNNRVLAWDLVKITTSSLSSGTTGVSYSQTLASFHMSGPIDSRRDLMSFASRFAVAGLRAWRILRFTMASSQLVASTLWSNRSAIRRLSVTFNEPAFMSARYLGPIF
jgi:DNA-binding beta-propeller fold protein YncE